MLLFRAAVSTGLLLCWEQLTQTIVTAGDAKVLRFWDAEHEMHVFDLPTGADFSVTAVDSTYSNVIQEHSSDVYLPKMDMYEHGLVMGPCGDDSGTGDSCGREIDKSLSRNGLVVAGFGDGSIRVFDRRCSPGEARIRSWKDGFSPILGTRLRGDKVISGRYLPIDTFWSVLVRFTGDSCIFRLIYVAFGFRYELLSFL